MAIFLYYTSDFKNPDVVKAVASTLHGIDFLNTCSGKILCKSISFAQWGNSLHLILAWKETLLILGQQEWNMNHRLIT